MSSNASLSGKRLNPYLFEDLKLIIKGGGVELFEATATVCGTERSNAYLSVQLLAKGNEQSPYLLGFPLKGSNAFETANKSYVNNVEWPYMETDRKIRCFFRMLANTLTFKGNDLSIEESSEIETKADA